jgi:hypothetical protein
MKRLLTPNKFFIAVIFFCLGFWSNHLLVKSKMSVVAEEARPERFPVDPADFDHESMLETIARMKAQGEIGASGLGEITQREDDKNVYYEIPLKGQDGNTHKLNVEIKNGMIKISEDVSSVSDNIMETSSERMFSIGPGLVGDKAEVINEKEKVIIKIPKK